MSPLKKIAVSCLICSLAFISKASADSSDITAYLNSADEARFNIPPTKIINYRDLMRENVNMLVAYAKEQNPNFTVIAYEGQDLLDKSLWEYHLDGYNEARKKEVNAEDISFLVRSKKDLTDTDPDTDKIAVTYLQNLDAIALNGLFCGNSARNQTAKDANLTIISIDNCASEEDFDDAIQDSVGEHILLYGYTNPHYAFNNVKWQPIINGSAKNISQVSQAANILFLTDDSPYQDKYQLIRDLRDSSHDIIVIDPLFHHQTPYSQEEVNSLKFKKNGTGRLVIALMNISEANRQEYYWNRKWKTGAPSWLEKKSPRDENYIITRYWSDTWKKIMSRHFKDIVLSGYDGVFFTGLENSKLFEQQTPLD